MEQLRPIGLANFWHRKPGPPHFPVQKRPQHRKPAFPWPDYEYEPCSDPEDLELRWEKEIWMAGDPKKNDECSGDLFSDSDLDVDSEPESDFG